MYIHKENAMKKRIVVPCVSYVAFCFTIPLVQAMITTHFIPSKTTKYLAFRKFLSTKSFFSNRIKPQAKMQMEKNIEKFIVTKNDFKSTILHLKGTWSEWFKSIIFGEQRFQVDSMFDYVGSKIDILIANNNFTEKDTNDFIKELKNNYSAILQETKQGITILGYILSEIYAYLNIFSYTPGNKKSLNIVLFFIALADNNAETKITKIITYLCALFKASKSAGIVLNEYDQKIFTKILQKIDDILLQKRTEFSKKHQLRCSLMMPIEDIVYLATVYNNLTGINLPLLRPETKLLMDKFNLQMSDCPLDLINTYYEKQKNIDDENTLESLKRDYNELIKALGFTSDYEYVLHAPFLDHDGKYYTEIKKLIEYSEGPSSRIKNYKNYLLKKNTIRNTLEKGIERLQNYE